MLLFYLVLTLVDSLLIATVGRQIPSGFCSRYPEIFSKFKVSIRKHVEDGICLPTVAINRLSTRVSTR